MSDKAEPQDEITSLIGSRTLQRQTKQVLDHVEQAGEPIVILRYGRPAAALVPIDEEQAKTLLLAASLRERRAAGDSDQGPEPQPLAVSEQEIRSEERLVGSEEESFVEASHLLEQAGKALSAEIGRLAQASRSIDVGDLSKMDSSLLAIQERNTRTLADLVVGFREQTETLNARMAQTVDEDLPA